MGIGLLIYKPVRGNITSFLYRRICIGNGSGNQSLRGAGCPGRFDHQMKVIGHEAAGMNVPIGFDKCFSKSVQEKLSICVVAKIGSEWSPRVMTSLRKLC